MRFLATFQIYDFLDTLVSLFTAFCLGTLIGAERQYRQRTAGLRTNVLVAVGAAAFVDLAMHLTAADGAVRVIAYVVSGIGFLGAGVIMKEGMNVRGLNTAATLWGSAAVGSCAGADMVAQAVALTAFVLAGNTMHAAPFGECHQPHSSRRTGVGGDLSCQARGYPGCIA
jgi:putative Mg2+ transporter-C (MgtC) family protein